MGSSPRVLSHGMKSTVSRSLQSLPTSSHSFEPGEENKVGYSLKPMLPLTPFIVEMSVSSHLVDLTSVRCHLRFNFYLFTDNLLGRILLFLYSG